MPIVLSLSWFIETLVIDDNNITSNPLSTPIHIVPEWYFLLLFWVLSRAFQ